MASTPPTPDRIRKRRALGLLGTALLLLAGAVLAAAQHVDYARPVEAAPQERDIGADYRTPVVQHAPPRAQWREAVDVGLLAVGLGLGAWLSLARRSRAGMLLLAVGGVAYFGFYRRGCVCPIGSIQNVAVALTDPQYAVSYFTVAIFLLPLMAAALFGRVFCGGVCPLGAIQELVLLRPIQVPARVDRALRWLRWAYLGLALTLAVRPAPVRDFIICRFDPFVPLFRFAGPAYMLVLGGTFLVLGTVIGRPYCRWLCPYGALLSLPARVAWRSVSITPDREYDCGLCATACPYGAIEERRAVRTDCVSCARCYRHCPRHHVPNGAPAAAAEARS